MKILELIDRKIEKLEELKVDSKKQTANISEGNLDGIEYLIKKREQIVRDVDLIDIEFLKEYENLKKENNLEELSGHEDKDIKDLQDKILNVKSISKEIMGIDQGNIRLMEALIEDNKKGLKQVKDGKKLNSAYNPKNLGSLMVDDDF